MTNRHVAFQAIGTRWSIKVDENIGNEDWSDLLKRINTRIEAFDRAYSRFRADSLVARMAAKAGSYELPEDGYAMLRFYERLYRATGGKVTPLIGQAISDAGYDAAYSFKAQAPQQPPDWQDVLSYDRHTLTLARPALLDFGAAGKGYLVDIVSDIVALAGAHSYLINAGGDMLHRSAVHASIDVGLENPQDTSEAVGIVRLTDRSLCASAGGKRRWGAYNHIIDPMVLRSPEHIVASWVIADDTMTADGLATALFFTPPDALQRQFRFSYALLDDGMNLYHTDDFPITTFTANR